MTRGPERALPPGIYERLVTRELARVLATFTAGTPTLVPLDAENAPDVLAQHLAPLIRRAIRMVCEDREETEGDTAKGSHVALYNELVRLLSETDDAIDGEPRVLTAVVPPHRGEVVAPRAPERRRASPSPRADSS